MKAFNSTLNRGVSQLKKSPFKSKGKGFAVAPADALRRGKKLRVRHPSDTNEVKDNIQFLLWQIVCKRYKDCILFGHPDAPPCGGKKHDGTMIYQADHLVPRSNSATYADSRLVVKVCKAHHGWKVWNKERYDALVRTRLPKAIVELWERCEAERYQPTRKFTADWKLAEVALKQELEKIKK